MTLPTHIDVLQTCSANAVEALVNFKTIDPLTDTEYSEYLQSIFTGRQRSGLTSFVLSNIKKSCKEIFFRDKYEDESCCDIVDVLQGNDNSFMRINRQ